VVPFGAGSTPDIVARLVADGLQKQYPLSSFGVENKPGASGNLGTDTVAKAAPDGSTIGVSIGGPLAINTLLFARLPYDPRKDIMPITQLVTQPSVLAVNPSLGVSSIAELVTLLKESPGKYNFASIGNGSLSHLAMEAIAIKAGTQLVHVPYTSSPQAITAVIRNDAQMACLPAIAVIPQAKAGAVKILAVSTARRSPYLPDVPTLKEAGIDVEADAWNGLIAPGGTTKSIAEKISKEVSAIIRRPAIREKLATQLMEPVGSSPDELRAQMDGEITRWAPVIKAANVRIN
jgi:tripartite-type tricarboxylate transporter receptor subunit TctC